MDSNDNTKMKRDVKDSLFRRMFSDPKYTLQLYQALHPEDTAVTIDDIKHVTIKNVLLEDDYNDLGFLVRNQMIILAEEQSTWSVNIVVRILMYYAETLKRYIDQQELNIYGSAPIEIPKPEFYVLYAGPKPERITRKAISLKDDILSGIECDLNVKVNVLANDKSGNIISQYMTFSKIIYEQVAIYGRTRRAVEEAIKICENKNILQDYLSGRETEVANMMDFLFDQERQIELYGKDKARRADARRIVSTVESAADNFNISIADACKGLNVSLSEYNRAKDLLERVEKETVGA